VDITTPMCNVITVNKFPGKFTHVQETFIEVAYLHWAKLALRFKEGSLQRALGISLSTPHSNTMACRSTFSSFKCLLGGTTWPKATISYTPCKILRGQKTKTFGSPFLMTNTWNGDSLLDHLMQSSDDFHFKQPSAMAAIIMSWFMQASKIHPFYTHCMKCKLFVYSYSAQLVWHSVRHLEDMFVMLLLERFITYMEVGGIYIVVHIQCLWFYNCFSFQLDTFSR